MSRTCEGCGGPNNRGPRAKYCSESCRQRAYFQSERGKSAKSAYLASEQGKKTKRAYSQSARAKSYWQSEQGRTTIKRSRAKQYGLTLERLEELLNAGCYAPGCPKVELLQIDHDHACCGGKGSCGKCVRGALCGFHNKYLGFLEKDWQFAVWIMSQPSLAMKIRRVS